MVVGIVLGSNTIYVNQSNYGPREGEAQRLSEASLDLLLGHPIMVPR